MHCGKTADRIRMPFGVVGRTGLEMRQIVGFGDRSTARGRIWCAPLQPTGTYFRSDAALFPTALGRPVNDILHSAVSLVERVATVMLIVLGEIGRGSLHGSFVYVVAVASSALMLQSSGSRQYCQWDTFNASCDTQPHHVILMTSSRYGRMKAGRSMSP